MANSTTGTTSESLAAELRSQLAASVWPAGTRLSTRELAQRYGVHRVTARRALKRLEQRGLVECRPRSGWYVCAGAVPDASRRREPPLRDALRGSPEALAGMQVALSLGISAADDLFADEPSWSGTITANLRRRLAEFGIDLLIWSHDPSQTPDVADVAGRLEQHASRLLGVVALNPLELGELEPLLDQHQVPWITVNRRDTSVMHNFVASDNTRAGRLTGRAFAMMGWRRIAVMAAALSEFPSEQEKVEGLCGGYLAEAGRFPEAMDVLICGGSLEDNGAQAMAAYLASHEPPEALFCCGDNVALGAIRACREHGLRVPEDISIVGNSGFDRGRLATPSLATFTQPMAEIGAAAADMLLEMRRQAACRIPGRVLPGRFILRDSLALSPQVRATLTQES